MRTRLTLSIVIRMIFCAAVMLIPGGAQTWVQKSPANSPTGRSGLSMAYDVTRSQVMMFGGSSGVTRLNDTWVWDGTNWAMKSPANQPPIRFWHSMAYDAAHRQVVLFGGSTGRPSVEQRSVLARARRRPK